MSKSQTPFVTKKSQTTKPERPEFDSCAVGCAIGKFEENSAHTNIKSVLEKLKMLPHRGGQIVVIHEGEEISVGDGAGVNCSIDWNCYEQIMQEFDLDKPQDRACGIGNFFLPIDEKAKKIASDKIAEIFKKNGVQMLQGNQGVWRKIPFNSPDSQAGKNLKLQNFEQCFLTPTEEISAEEFEKKLLKVYAQVEEFSVQLNKEFREQNLEEPKLAVASISCEKVVYKGMILPHEVSFFDDLLRSNPEVVIYHIRQSTNRKPSPGNAQPFFIIAHNGELNSSEGNAYKNHRAARGYSDSRIFDEHLRELQLQGMDLVEALTTLMPPPNTDNPEIDEMLSDIKSKGLEYNGPAHMLFFSKDVQGAKLDCSALRPSRFLIAEKKSNGEKHLYVGSEDMFDDEELEEMGLQVVERGMLQAGEMILIEKGVVKKNEQILQELKDRYQPTNQKIVEISAPQKLELPKKSLDVGGVDYEDRRYKLIPLCKGDVAKVAMGNDTNRMETDPKKIPGVEDHVLDKFSQVSSPALDPDKEKPSFDLTTYLGNKGLPANERKLYKVESPILKAGQLDQLLQEAGDEVAKFDLTFDLEKLSVEERGNKEWVLKALRNAVLEICHEAAKQARAGKAIIVLDSTNVSKSKIALPDIYVTAAVSAHLKKLNEDYYKHGDTELGLKNIPSIVVNSSRMDSPHYFSVLSALGANAVNPAGIYDFAFSEFTKLEKDETERQKKYQKTCENIQHAIEEKGHMVTMAKFGINSSEVYCGSRLVETNTLDLQEIDENYYDPTCVGEAFEGVKSCDGFNGIFTAEHLLADCVRAHQRKYDDKILTCGEFSYTPTGVDHTFNSTIVKALRLYTTDNNRRRYVSRDYAKKAELLEAEIKKIEENLEFDFAKNKADLEKNIENTRSQISRCELEKTRLEGQNSKAFNSLFFIDKIAQEFAETLKSRKEQMDARKAAGEKAVYSVSINETKLRGFLAVQENDFSSKIIQKNPDELNRFADELKSSATDQNEVKKIEQWFENISKKEAKEATEVMNSLERESRKRIREFSGIPLIQDVCKNYMEGKIEFVDFKKALFSRAGYDESEMEKIEEWAKLTLEEDVYAAANIMASLNQKNQERVREVYDQYLQNKDEIAALKVSSAKYSDEQNLGNILLHASLEKTNREDYLAALKQRQAEFEEQARANNILPTIKDGKFDVEEMNNREVDESYAKAMREVKDNKLKHPVTIADRLEIKFPTNVAKIDRKDLQPVSEILANSMKTGGMSYGALTKVAHNDIAKAVELIGGKACTGEGGIPDGQKAKVVQVASGRFALTMDYFLNADEVEIKIVQGAKQGEGGMMPAGKVSVEIAAKRRSTVGVGLISPPPHHDIYSIEDLQGLIHDLKELKPGVEVAVKISAAEGVDQVAMGLAKSGADRINITDASGGTGAAQIGSRKTGGPSIYGLVMSHIALMKAGIRDLVKLEASGFPNTPEGLVMLAILGGDCLESGTTDLMLLGCDMHRKCNVPGACGPGITNNEEGYQGHAEDLALYKLNMARAVQDLLQQLGVKSLKELRGRTDLLSAENLKEHLSEEAIATLMQASNEEIYPQISEENRKKYKDNANKGSNLEQYAKLKEAGFNQAIAGDEKAEFDGGKLDVTNRTFGATLDLANYKTLRQKAEDHITIKTHGNAGQSFGAFTTHGLRFVHTGCVQDGFGKSMSGGVLVVKQPEAEKELENSVYVGNAAMIGAMGGKAFIPSAGSRCAILMKGATLVVNGKVGTYACQYMTSGSFVALGEVGKHFGSGMTGGIAMLYDNQKKVSPHVRAANSQEAKDYEDALKTLLEEDFKQTGSLLAKKILDNFEIEKTKFQILIPKEWDKFLEAGAKLEKLLEHEKSFYLRDENKGKALEEMQISPFEKVWLEVAKKKLIAREAEKSSAVNLTNYEYVEQSSLFAEAAKKHQQEVQQYGTLAKKVFGGLGVSDETMSDNLEEMIDELFNLAKKCSCNATFCTSGEKIDSPSTPKISTPKISAAQFKQDKHPETGCPIGKNPNEINPILQDQTMSREERVRQAFKRQIAESPFAGFTGAACPAPCQDSCTHSSGDAGNADAVKIKRIELLLHRIADKMGLYEEFKVFEAPQKVSDKKVMIIGSGPSALEAAYQMAKQGVQVEIFEKSSEIGGLLRFGIPDHKLQKDIIDTYVEKMKKMGVKFHVNSEIDIDKVKETHSDFDLYFDARGVAGAPLSFHKEFEKTNVRDGGNHSMAMDFLTYANLYSKGSELAKEHPFKVFNLGKRCAAIGAGDTATDIKETIMRLNNQLPESEQVTLITINRQPILKDRANIGAGFPKTREKRAEGLHKSISRALDSNEKQVEQFDDTTPDPKKLVYENGRISEIGFDKTFSMQEFIGRDFRKSFKIGEGSIKCDSVITAIGFGAPKMNQETITNLSEMKQGSVVAIGDTASKFRISRDGKQTSYIQGGKELIVNSQRSGKDAALHALGVLGVVANDNENRVVVKKKLGDPIVIEYEEERTEKRPSSDLSVGEVKQLAKKSKPLTGSRDS